MVYWRMHLHPGDRDRSAYHAAASVSRGLIGLDFHQDVGHLRAPHREIEAGQRSYRRFLTHMEKGDLVLVVAHHRPFALVEVTGEYEYDPKKSHGLWFRHSRRVENVRYYADHVHDPGKWERVHAVDTIAQLSADGDAYRLVERWANAG